MPKLYMEQKELCDKPISEAEILTSIKIYAPAKLLTGVEYLLISINSSDIKNLLAQSITYAMIKR